MKSPIDSETSSMSTIHCINPLRRWGLIGAGLVCVGLAYLGALLPGLPTTPWLLLASYCFARSSPRLQRWLLRSPMFGRLLRDWHEHRGIRAPVKVTALVMVTGALTISLGFTALPLWLKGGIAACGLIGISIILFLIPTIRGNSSELGKSSEKKTTFAFFTVSFEPAEDPRIHD
jgi:uncharacterized membrane protein YbaN (DUF454 family)